MGTGGWLFAAELSQLRVIGTVDLPALGFTYASMNRAVEGTKVQEGGAFQGPGLGTAKLYTVWFTLRNDLQDVFGRTAENMHSAAGTMLHIVQAYADTDEEAARSLSAAWSDGRIPGLQEDERGFRRDAPPVLQNDA